MSRKTVTPDQVKSMANKMNSSFAFAFDMIVLAGGDLDLVVEASINSSSSDAMKAYITDKRMSKIEEAIADA